MEASKLLLNLELPYSPWSQPANNRGYSSVEKSHRGKVSGLPAYLCSKIRPRTHPGRWPSKCQPSHFPGLSKLADIGYSSKRSQHSKTVTGSIPSYAFLSMTSTWIYLGPLERPVDVSKYRPIIIAVASDTSRRWDLVRFLFSRL